MRRSVIRLGATARSARPNRALVRSVLPVAPQGVSPSRSLSTFRPLFAAHALPAATRQRSDKVWASADEAVADLKSGSMVLSAGFGLCGTAETLIAAIARRSDLRDLTAVSNNAGNSGDGGLGELEPQVGLHTASER